MPGRSTFALGDPYAVLGLNPDCDFAAIKKAYYRRVKQCHPDLFQGASEKEEEFKVLAAAFDILSDPDKRRRHDIDGGLAAPSRSQDSGEPESVMDTAADDILEELIVDNMPPPGTTIATLLLDLQKTEVFVTFREGKTLFAAGRFDRAAAFFRQAAGHSPGNILYRIYLARSCMRTESWWEAGRHYRIALRLAARRMPPQHLARVRQEWEDLRRLRHPWWQRLTRIFAGPPPTPAFFNPEAEMIDETNRAIARLLRESQRQAAQDRQAHRQLPK